MAESGTGALSRPEESVGDVLTEILREGARKMLARAIEDEVAEYIEAHREAVDEAGHRLMVRNGRKRKPTIKATVASLTDERRALYEMLDLSRYLGG